MPRDNTQDDIEFMRETSAAALLGPRVFSHLILWGTLLFVFVALIWAYFARLDEVTSGEGKVIPSSQVQVIQNLEGGILSELLVHEGEAVEKDQVLLKIDDTRFSSSYREGRSKYVALTAKAARLDAEVTQTEFVVPTELEKDAPDLVQNEKALYLSRKSDLETKVSILRQQADQKRQQLVELRSKQGQQGQSYDLVVKELNLSRPLVEQGVLSEVELLRLERQGAELKGDLDASRLAIPRLESLISEAEKKVEDLVATFRNEAQEELNKIKAELSGLTESNTALQDRFARTVVKSPVKGLVKQIKVTTIGGVIQPGMDLLEIVPTDDTLLVEARIRPKDIAFLRPGQEAVVKFTAYDYSIYGGLTGTLEHISADTIIDEHSQNKDSYYLIRVRTQKRDYRGAENKPLTIIPGMTVTVDILTGQKSVLDYLLKPILKTREVALRER